jgi:acyl carrier protein
MKIDLDLASLETTVCEMMARACNLGGTVISPNASVYDLGLDSMSATSLLSELEALYEVEFSPEKIVEILQAPFVRDLIAIVREVVQGPSLAIASEA